MTFPASSPTHNLRSLPGTLVTDSGLEHLAEVKGLTILRLHETRVTPAGVSKLQLAISNCRIILKD
jgi:hypothetical protein